MDKLISQQAAIDEIFNEPLYESGMKRRYADVVVPAIYEKIKSLPSAQPDTTTHDSIPAETGKNDGDRTSGDCISRQMAIDALKEKVFHNLSDEFYGAMQVLDELPSAQPDIIHCKDCKFYTAYDYTGKLMCKRIGKGMILPKPEDYCSYAERITDGRPN